MQNLARATDANDYQRTQVEQTVLRELKRCRIPAIEQLAQGEVPYKHVGKLGDFMFERAWYYWVVYGPVPLYVAKELYEDVVGVTDIRVSGHCGCPPPELPWIHCYDEQGRKLTKLKDAQEQATEEAMLDRIHPNWRDEYVYVEDPENVAVRSVVEDYHIDSELGLRIFVDTLAKHGIVQLKDQGASL